MIIINNYYIILENEDKHFNGKLNNKYFLCRDALGKMFWKLSELSNMEDIYWMNKDKSLTTNQEIIQELINYKKFILEHPDIEKDFLKNWFPILTDGEKIIITNSSSLKINKIEDFI